MAGTATRWAGTPELRMVILDALATLPPRARVVVVTPVDTRTQTARRASSISGQPVAIVIVP